MRLGAYPCAISEGTHAFEAYKTANINERHRHRYEFNNAYRERLADMGMVFSGQSPDGTLVEIVEIPITRGSWAASSIPNSSPAR